MSFERRCNFVVVKGRFESSWLDRDRKKVNYFELCLSNVNRVIPLLGPCCLRTSGCSRTLIHMPLSISVFAHIISVRASSPPDINATSCVREGRRVTYRRARSKIRRGDSIYGLVARVVSNESRCGGSIRIVRVEISHRVGRPRLLVSCKKC